MATCEADDLSERLRGETPTSDRLDHAVAHLDEAATGGSVKADATDHYAVLYNLVITERVRARPASEERQLAEVSHASPAVSVHRVAVRPRSVAVGAPRGSHSLRDFSGDQLQL